MEVVVFVLMPRMTEILRLIHSKKIRIELVEDYLKFWSLSQIVVFLNNIDIDMCMCVKMNVYFQNILYKTIS